MIRTKNFIKSNTNIKIIEDVAPFKILHQTEQVVMQVQN
jgi:hypothetical protein